MKKLLPYQNLQEGLGLRGADQQSARLFIHQLHKRNRCFFLIPVREDQLQDRGCSNSGETLTNCATASRTFCSIGPQGAGTAITVIEFNKPH
jgi:hypothetical protein